MSEWIWLGLILLTLWPWCFYPACLLLFPKKGFVGALEDRTEGVLRICLNQIPRKEWLDVWNRTLEKFPEIRLEIGLDGFSDKGWLSGLTCPERVRVFCFEVRVGKSALLNVMASQSEIQAGLLFLADADTHFQPEDLRTLSRALGEEVGLVAAEVEYEEAEAFEIRYMKWENRLRREENARGFHAGLSGALMCLRVADFQPLQADCPSDMELCLQLVCRGKPSIALPEVKVFESLAHRDLARRRTRTLIRGFRCVLRYIPILLEARAFNTVFSLIFRKILRWLSPVFLLLSFLIAFQTGHPAVFLIGTLLVLLRLIGPSRGMYLIQAWLLAIWDILRGRKHVAW